MCLCSVLIKTKNSLSSTNDHINCHVIKRSKIINMFNNKYVAEYLKCLVYIILSICVAIRGIKILKRFQIHPSRCG